MPKTRPIDYVSLNLSISFGIELSAQITVTRQGRVFIGAGAGLATPGASASLRAAYLDQRHPASEQEINNFIGKWSVSGSGGVPIGSLGIGPSIGKTYGFPKSPTNLGPVSANEFGLAIGVPEITGREYSYSWLLPNELKLNPVPADSREFNLTGPLG